MTTPRRDFLKTAGLIGAGSLLTPKTATAVNRTRKPIDEYDPRNVKLARRVSGSLSDDDMMFLQQLGLRSVRVDLTRQQANLGFLRDLQKRFAKHNIQIYSAVHPVQGSVNIGLGRPERDAEIREYQDFLKALGRLKIPVAGYAFHPGNTYSTGRVVHRGYSVRVFDLDVFRKSVEKMRFGREYGAEEMWGNYEYFIKRVLPVAEDSDVRMALHPDDPPVAKMNGVAKLFTHFDGYKRANEIAGRSPHWGVLLCVGTWSEGGKKMGKDVFEMIRYWGKRKQLFAIHFRNVSGTLPRFFETFPDDGYQDMPKVMRTLREVGFNGTTIGDHIPRMINDSGLQRAGAAYCVAYMRALLKQANRDVG
ncbi:MAG: mannonate dehydratase [Planctomycetaceae bacterium]|nr:MAG: mannonate dehydratase [Planctomycetaceae bacterium]